MLDETKNLTRITEDLLLLAREDANLGSRKSDRVPVSEVLEETIRDMRVLAERKGIELRMENAPPVIVYASRNGLKRIFVNIMDNAIKYSHENGHVLISVAETKSGMVLVKIKDGGVGISESDLSHVFARFYKADNARQSSGSGLGLSIVKQLVESYGGSVAVESVCGKGTTVIIRLKN